MAAHSPGMALAAGLLAAALAGPAAACTADADLTARDLLGLWRAEFDDGRHAATLLLTPNANWPGSLAGSVNRGGLRAQLAGDLEDGELTLEESADGRRIDATWTGTPVAGRCGHEIRGTWQRDGHSGGRGFVLRRLADG